MAHQRRMVWWAMQSWQIATLWVPVLSSWGQESVYWNRNKMNNILPTTFSSGFSWMKSAVLWFQFYRRLSLTVQLTINLRHWFRKWLGMEVASSHYRNHSGPCLLSVYASLGRDGLTLWGRDKMNAISQTKFSNEFSWMKMYEFCLRCDWNVFLKCELRIFPHWFRYWLGAGKQQIIIWPNGG